MPQRLDAASVRSEDDRQIVGLGLIPIAAVPGVVRLQGGEESVFIGQPGPAQGVEHILADIDTLRRHRRLPAEAPGQIQQRAVRLLVKGPNVLRKLLKESGNGVDPTDRRNVLHLEADGVRRGQGDERRPLPGLQPFEQSRGVVFVERLEHRGHAGLFRDGRQHLIAFPFLRVGGALQGEKPADFLLRGRGGGGDGLPLGGTARREQGQANGRRQGFMVVLHIVSTLWPG